VQRREAFRCSAVRGSGAAVTSALLQVFSRAVLGCVAELQSSAGDAPPELSPAWITAAAERFAPRLDCLRHAFRLQPRLAAAVHQQASEAEPREMVRITNERDC